MANLILLEDESLLRAELSEFLVEQGEVVDAVASLQEFSNIFDPSRHEIALLDLGLPDGDGIELIKRLRLQCEKLGIIVLTARSSPSTKVQAFNWGADHYLCKPFDLSVLAATVSALARRLGLANPVRAWALDTLRCELTPPGKQALALTAHSYIVFRCIAAGQGSPVTRRTIVEALGENYFHYDQRRLDTQMHQLRKQVYVASGLELPVRAARGRGYFIVERVILQS